MLDEGSFLKPRYLEGEGGDGRLYPGVDVMGLRATYYEMETSWWLGSAGAENLEEASRN